MAAERFSYPANALELQFPREGLYALWRTAESRCLAQKAIAAREHLLACSFAKRNNVLFHFLTRICVTHAPSGICVCVCVCVSFLRTLDADRIKQLLRSKLHAYNPSR